MSTTRVGRRRRPSTRSLRLANAYRAQIGNAVRDGYPKLAAAIGEAAFDVLVAAYLARYPSTRLSGRGAGAQLPEFLARSAEHPVWHGELALLDRAVTDVMNVAEVALARTVEPDAWVRLIPAHAIVELTTTADELWRAIDAHDMPTFPRELDWPRTTLVWRRGEHLHQRVVAADEVAAVRAASRGVRLSELCTRFRAPNPMARAVDIVLAWIEDGVVAA
jgi:hypothetical protein